MMQISQPTHRKYKDMHTRIYAYNFIMKESDKNRFTKNLLDISLKQI